jgi:hypothetical protein
MSALPGAVECLRKLRAAGFAIAVCSNWGWDLQADLQGTGLVGQIDVFVPSARAGVFVTMRRLLRGRYEGAGRNVPSWSHGRALRPATPEWRSSAALCPRDDQFRRRGERLHPRPAVRIYVRLRQQHRTDTDTPRPQDVGVQAVPDEVGVPGREACPG